MTRCRRLHALLLAVALEILLGGGGILGSNRVELRSQEGLKAPVFLGRRLLTRQTVLQSLDDPIDRDIVSHAVRMQLLA